MNFSIVEMENNHWNSVAAIYLEGINTKIATFQTEVPTWKEWDNSHLSICRLVAKSEDEIMGWVELSPTSSRCVYKGVAEVSLYISEKYRSKGIGTELLKSVISLSEKNNIWTLQSGIIKANKESIKLHEKCGFRQLGIRERVGKMHDGTWHDVVLMERRSKIVGID